MTEIRLERQGAAALITIDRPHARNALARPTFAELRAAIAEVAAGDASLLVLRGAGDRAFVAGGDLRDLAQVRTLSDAQELAASMREVLDALVTLPIPVLGALNGDALGGGAETAVACDFRIAASHARIGFSQARLGIMPAWGGIERLGELVGRGRALYLLTTGATLSASDAARWGLIEEVVPSESFEPRLAALVEELAEVPRAVLTGLKRVVGQVRPNFHPATAAVAVDAFAATWIDDAHWQAAARRETERRRARGTD